ASSARCVPSGAGASHGASPHTTSRRSGTCWRAPSPRRRDRVTEHEPHGARPGHQRDGHAHEEHEGHELDFDARAATWDDDPEKVERARVVAELVRRVTPLSGSTRVLEYGAGTALLGQALVPHIGPLTVADPSVGMREVLAQKVSS